tara:strand:- start:590 stop:1150 length:561 start_codon:yes stop_codon:yes gene_type:complete
VSDNMTLWDKVSKTNPAHTKPVKLGRSITAIDPYRQIEAATEQFGAAGDGWGWSVVKTEFLSTNEVCCLVRLWHKSPDKFIEQWGQNGLYIDKKELKKDTDCMKKATTDGLTKCLSMLGFNADVFLGKFDDNKYIQQMQAEFAEPIVYEIDDNATGWINAAKADASVLNQLKDAGYRAFIKEQAGV